MLGFYCDMKEIHSEVLLGSFNVTPQRVKAAV
jgi:hypothetical protein